MIFTERYDELVIEEKDLLEEQEAIEDDNEDIEACVRRASKKEREKGRYDIRKNERRLEEIEGELEAIRDEKEEEKV